MPESLTPVSRQQRRAQERRRRKQEQKSSKLSPGVALTLGAASLVAVPQAGADCTVTTLTDPGAGSLRACLAATDTTPGLETIDFAAALSGTITLTAGQLTIYDSVNIVGPGPGVITVSGGGVSRVFYLYNGGALADVTISGLTITGGGGVTFGAGIVDFGENLTLDDVVITGNTSTAGGAGLAATDLSADGMSLQLLNSTVSGNTTGRGGGIYFYTTGGPMVIQNSVISGNDATISKGGGIYLYDITDSLTIVDSTVTGNTATTLGGGMYFYQTDGGTQTFDHSTFSGNSGTYGGGLFFVFADTPITVDHSTFSGNSANYGGGMFAAFAFGAPIVVVDSTISGNSATAGSGGGIFFYFAYAGGTFDVENSTLASNTSTADGGGMFSNFGDVGVENSIAADNTGSNDLGSGTGTFNVSFSLVENTTGSSINNIVGNVFGVDPQLGPLANNGGLTQTQKPATTSPVVNTGDPAFAPPPTTDQRDLARVVAGRIDMGAVELGLPGTIQLTYSATSVGEADGFVTVTATRTGGSEGAVSVTLSAADITANGGGVDYGPGLPTVLSWPDGDTASKSFNIPIVDDPDDEPDETFLVTLSTPTGGATLGSPSTATITIVDDDLPISVIDVPTVGEWGLVFLTGLLTMAGLYSLRRKQGLAAPMLVLTLMSGGATVAKAQTAPPPHTVSRDARAVLLSEVNANGQAVTLRLSDGAFVQVNLADLAIKDRRGRPMTAPDLKVQDLRPGQPLIVKVRRGPDGLVKQVRVQVYATLAQAQQALQRQQQRQQ